MTLKQQIDQDLIKALKTKDRSLGTLRLIKNAFHNAKIAKQKDLTDVDAIQVLNQEAKQRKEAILEYQKGNRQDLVKNETQELEIIKEYLPKQLSEQEISQKVKIAISQTQAQSPQDLGKVMGKLMPEIKGLADGQKVSEIVQKELSK